MKTVICWNNAGLEDFLVVGQSYQVAEEDKEFYYLEGSGCAYYKKRFNADTQECLDSLAKALDEEGVSEEEKNYRVQDLKEVIEKTEALIKKAREEAKLTFLQIVRKRLHEALQHMQQEKRSDQA